MTSFTSESLIMHHHCALCVKSYTRSQDLNRHIRDKHSMHETAKPESMQDFVECPDNIFHAPTTISISGTTGSGKTSLLFEILKYKKEMFTIPVRKVLYCYGIWQQLFDQKEEELGIDFHEGLPSEDFVDTFADGEHNIIILDDLMDQVVNNKNVQHLFTRGSHHRNLTIIFINQNMFAQGQCSRTLNLNTHYIILMKNPRSVSQVSMLSRQIGFGKTMPEAYQDCTSNPYGYLLVDLSPHSVGNFRLKTRIFPGEDTIVYTPL